MATEYKAASNNLSKLSNVTQTIVRQDPGIKAGDMTENVKFPHDLGATHHPDYIAFYFLDIVGASGADLNSGLRVRTGLQEASKQTSKLGKIKLAGVDAIISSSNAVEEIASKLGTSAEYLDFGDTYAKTGDAVKLMMPMSVQFNDGAGWQAINSSPTGAGMLANAVMGEGGLIANLVDIAAKEAAGWVSSLLNEGGQQALETVSKKTINPYVSQAFEAMQRRQFRFDWNLVPKNNDELLSIKKIIDIFRYNMHPSLSANNMFLRYPSQVDIQFISDEGMNEWLPRITTCVIKDFNVNYTPNNQWATVSNDTAPGAPYQYQISVTVEEITPLVKQDIVGGY